MTFIRCLGLDLSEVGKIYLIHCKSNYYEGYTFILNKGALLFLILCKIFSHESNWLYEYT